MTFMSKSKTSALLRMSKEQIENVPLQVSNVTSGEEQTERAQWSNAFQGVIAQLGYSVGLANLWRFPYVCQRNGGGAFLIPHIICILVLAIPLFFLEIALGQFSRKGPIRVWAMCPPLKGIGYGILIVNCVIVPYYSMVFAWALYYLYNSFSTVLPWTTCGNSWNTPQCVAAAGSRPAINSSTMNAMLSLDTTRTADSNLSGTFKNAFGHTSTEEFWQYKVLVISSSLEDMGSLQPHLVICWILTCVSMFLCLMKGVKSLGKVWLEALLHVFYSSGPAWGSLIVIASHNPPGNNIVRDAVVVTLLGELTSVYAGFIVFATVGFLAHTLEAPVADVITSGVERFSVDVEAMIGKRLPVVYKLMCFIVVPALLLASMVLTIVAYKPPTYADYEYPPIAVTIAAIYEGEWCVGRIEDIDHEDGDCEITFLQKSKGLFKWLAKEDKLWVDGANIIGAH
ncbi:sodium-dependent noradrenaline transporter-like [Haliotis rubra]|uniref:sodium-dependent noradrenaline transporter-like n=1 Tax=Haliotis rubra TaxID=36100 RepID=UPI001EE5C71A|nr:sodium-dependent noradrenaline transporter-like [Haliotis rubra]